MVMILSPGPLHAQSGDASPKWFEHNVTNAWLQAYDPTLVSRRFVSEFTYEGHDRDEDFWKIENTLRWGIPIRDELAFGLQAMVPVRWIDTAASDASGTGDLELRTGVVGRFCEDWRYGVGLNAAFDTASDPSLGGSALILRPTLALRWDATTRLNLGLNVEYSFTPRDEEADDVSALELKFPLALKLTDVWSAAATYKPRWNLLAESDRHRLELTGTRVWGENKQYAFSFGTEFPLSSESLDLKLISSLTLYF